MIVKVHSKLINTHILNSCFTKEVHKTEEAAKQFCLNNNIITEGKKHELEPYHCKYCKNYHLTKKAKTKRRNLSNEITLNNFGLRKNKGPKKKRSKEPKVELCDGKTGKKIPYHPSHKAKRAK